MLNHRCAEKGKEKREFMITLLKLVINSCNIFPFICHTESRQGEKDGNIFFTSFT